MSYLKVLACIGLVAASTASHSRTFDLPVRSEPQTAIFPIPCDPVEPPFCRKPRWPIGECFPTFEPRDCTPKPRPRPKPWELAFE